MPSGGKKTQKRSPKWMKNKASKLGTLENNCSYHFKTVMEPQSQKQLLRFLHEDLAIPSSALEMATRLAEVSVGSLPMILWQYGLIDLNQLEQVFDWIEVV